MRLFSYGPARVCPRGGLDRLPLRTRRRLLWTTLSAAILLAAFCPLAHSQEAPSVSATVVALDGQDLVLDLSRIQGASIGDVVEVWRPIRVKHPVTGKVITDRFQIGRLRLIQVGPNLTLAKPEGTMSRNPQVGDIVQAPGMVPASSKPPAGANAPASVPSGSASGPSPTAPLAPEAQSLSQLFDSLRGTDPATRIRAYEERVRANPSGRFAAVLYEEAQALRLLLSKEPSAPSAEPRNPSLIRFLPPSQLLSHTPVSLGLQVDGPVAGVVIHNRNPGQPTYRSLQLHPSGQGFWTGTLPGSQITGSNLEYFVEGVRPDGATVALRGTSSAPERLSIEDRPEPNPPEKRQATVALLTDYADYNRSKGNDYAWQTEGYFGLRYNDVGIRALRSGFGVYRGAGGSIDELDVQNKEPRRIGLTYGYLELELGASDFISLIGRATMGLRDEGTTGGGQLLLRIGNDQKTNLLLGGEVLGGVGLRGITQLELNTFPRVPIVLRSEVTNQPAGVSDSSPRPLDSSVPKDKTASDSAEVGARGIFQVGYRFTPSLTLSGRLSYQGRTTKHAGPGIGAGVMYQW